MEGDDDTEATAPLLSAGEPPPPPTASTGSPSSGRRRSSQGKGLASGVALAEADLAHAADDGESGAAAGQLLKQPVNPFLKGFKYVIFPDNRYAQMWDFTIIMAIWYYSFYIPFHFGISAGYYTVSNTGFYRFTTATNVLFFVDTFLAFFRAYRDENGLIVFNLKSIRNHYFRSGWFFINIMASLPITTLVYQEARDAVAAGTFGNFAEGSNLRYYFLLEAFKLLRLLRIKKIMQTSEVMTKFWERINVEIALTAKFCFMIILASHWIACIWGLLAFQQAGSFGDPLLESLNWISNWHKNSYVEGGLDPIGWDNPIQRYWLCLFWAIQSITSIGYGNIAPVTAIEFAFANFLMLLCGVFWAYIIGNLVEVVKQMGSRSQEYMTRMNEANQMVKDFTVKELPESVIGSVYAKSSKRIRRFITNQRDATKNWSDSNACTLAESYPTLGILSPELRQVCALHLSYSLLETIPYLSSRYLSPEEQAEIALQCVMLEFSSAERFFSHPELGRGILIIRRGYSIVSRNIANEPFRWQKEIKDKPIDVDEVLMEDDYFKERQLHYHFVGFTKVFFVPRDAIMRVLEKNEKAWKECARWRYFMAALRLYSLKDSPMVDESHEILFP